MMRNLSRETTFTQFHKARPFFGVVYIQFGLAGLNILFKAALNEGTSNYVFIVYRHAIAAIFVPQEEKAQDQNLYFLGLKYTTAKLAASMCNILPAVTFLMACLLRLEKFEINSIHSQAKVAGTVGTVAGAMLVTLLRGRVIELPWTKESSSNHGRQRVEINIQNSFEGSLMITIGCFCCASFTILQAITLKTYPAELSLTAWICLFGTAGGTMVALVMEKGKAAVWSINWDTKFLAVYSKILQGKVSSGLAYYIQEIVLKDKGPVFVTAFGPFSLVIVAVLSSFILAEQVYLGR
ncbi:WAT1-related protein At2g37460-like [Olea europaea var. sylvestris]|uniref:WAT1-related protein At2g37460-like n=1 Tax=Olea europaea var. sylvestris TaxID=158386 RepID=UPI000C1D715E|nr:WAT1-related protein At2g37460-like [Olea europaea var. sylvestris]